MSNNFDVTYDDGSTLSQRMAERGVVSYEEQFKDVPAVQTAVADLKAAETKLADLKTFDVKEALKSDPEWRRAYGNDLMAAHRGKQQLVQEAQKALETAKQGKTLAISNAIKARNQAAETAKQNQQRQEREARQLEASKVEEARQRSLYLGRWKQAGGTEESFKSSWPAMWQEHLKQAAQQQTNQFSEEWRRRFRASF